MAIDFGRLARGVATGYLSAKIANTEANDRLKEDMIRGVGENYLNNTLPEFQKRERIRKDTYNKIATTYGDKVAEHMDYSGFITGDESDFENITTTLGDKTKFDPDYLNKLNEYLTRVKPGTYQERAATRMQTIKDREKFIMDGLINKGGFGANTIKNQLGIGMEEPTEAPAVPTETTETPSETLTTQRPTLYDIYGLTTGKTEPMSDSQFRLRTNDILANAMQGYGLEGKFTRDAQGGLQLTSIEEADQTAFQALNEIVANNYAANPERKDYLNIANEASNFAKEIANASSQFNTATTTYFNQNNLPMGTTGAANDDVFNQWLQQNSALLITYGQSTPTIQNFIRSKYIQIQGNQGFEPFFDKYDEELAKLEE